VNVAIMERKKNKLSFSRALMQSPKTFIILLFGLTTLTTQKSKHAQNKIHGYPFNFVVTREIF